MCQGPASSHDVIYQNIKLKDFYGTTVNLASRMESKVAEKDQIAFCFNKTKIPKNVILELSQYFNMEIKDFTDECKMKKLNRSGRLLGYQCLSKKLLKGVPGVKAFIIRMN